MSTAAPRGSSIRKFAFIGFAAVFAASVVLRMLFGDRRAPNPSPLPEGARSLAGQVAEDHPREAGVLESILPYVTEASLFGLIGFALGYTSRKAFKLALVLIALAFVTLQVLVAMEKIDVDWSGVVRAVDGWILNMDFGATVPEFLKHRVPTLIAFGIGYLFGLRKG